MSEEQQVARRSKAKSSATKETATRGVVPPPRSPDVVPIVSAAFNESPQVDSVGSAFKVIKAGSRARNDSTVVELSFDRVAHVVLIAMSDGTLMAVPSSNVRAMVVRR